MFYCSSILCVCVKLGVACNCVACRVQCGVGKCYFFLLIWRLGGAVTAPQPFSLAMLAGYVARVCHLPGPCIYRQLQASEHSRFMGRCCLLSRQLNTSMFQWLDAVDALSAAASSRLLLALHPSAFLDPMALTAAVCLSSLLGRLAISLATARSTANVVPRSTGSITRMPPVREVNCHVCVSRKRIMAGPRWTLLTGSHDGFHTTSTSFSPVSDERSAKMSCTSHKGSLLFAGSVAAADWLRSRGIMSLSFVAAECVILSIAGSTCDGCGWTDSVREVLRGCVCIMPLRRFEYIRIYSVPH